MVKIQAEDFVSVLIRQIQNQRNRGFGVSHRVRRRPRNIFKKRRDVRLRQRDVNVGLGGTISRDYHVFTRKVEVQPRQGRGMFPVVDMELTDRKFRVITKISGTFEHLHVLPAFTPSNSLPSKPIFSGISHLCLQSLKQVYQQFKDTVQYHYSCSIVGIPRQLMNPIQFTYKKLKDYIRRACKFHQFTVRRDLEPWSDSFASSDAYALLQNILRIEPRNIWTNRLIQGTTHSSSQNLLAGKHLTPLEREYLEVFSSVLTMSDFDVPYIQMLSQVNSVQDAVDWIIKFVELRRWKPTYSTFHSFIWHALERLSDDAVRFWMIYNQTVPRPSWQDQGVVFGSGMNSFMLSLREAHRNV